MEASVKREIEAMKYKHVAAAMLLMAAWTPLAAGADCINLSIKAAKRYAAFVFDGTVTALERLETGEYMATLDVHRVWKGKVPTKVSVYYVASIDGPSYNERQRTIIFAVPHTAKYVEDFHLPATAPHGTLWVPSCLGLSPDDHVSIKQLGRSRKPSDH
jgi:hypothetical protein